MVLRAESAWGMRFSNDYVAHCVTAAHGGLKAEPMPWGFALFQERFSIEDGEIALPDRPGFGPRLDLKAIEWLQLDF